MEVYELSRSEMEVIINEYIWSEQYRAIFKRRIFDDIKYEQLAEEFDMSERHIKRIVFFCKDIVFRHTKRPTNMLVE